MVYHDLSSASTLPKVHFQPAGHLMNVSKLFHYTKMAGFPSMLKKLSSLPTLYLACQFQIYSACLYSTYHRVFSKITAQNSCNGPKNSARIVPSNCTGKWVRSLLNKMKQRSLLKIMAKHTINCKSPLTKQQSMDFWQILVSACIVYCRWKETWTNVVFSLQFYISCSHDKSPQYCWLLPLLLHQFSRNISKRNMILRPLSLCQLLEEFKN